MQPVEGSAPARMQGAIEGFDAATGTGVIAGPGGVRYRFSVTDLAAGVVPTVWRRVEFAADGDGCAIAIDLEKAGSRFDVGRVIQRTFRALGQHLLWRFCAAAILVGVPGAIAAWGGAAMSDGRPLGLAAFWLGTLAGRIGGYVLMGFVVSVAVNDFRGRSTTVAEALRAWSQVAIPLTGLAFLCTLGIIVGAIFFIIPAIVFALWWSVAAPVLVIERRRITECMRRSIELTDGYRGQIFGLFVIYGLLSWIVALAIGFVLGASFGAILGQGSAWMAAMVGQALASIITALVWATGGASLYHELRTLKDGDEPDQLAAIFE